MPDDPGWVLWTGTLGYDSTVAARVDAAHAAGCTRIGLSAPDLAGLAAAGRSPADVGRWLRDVGLEVLMDPVMCWHGGAPLSGPFDAFTADDELRLCEELGVVALTAIGPFAAGEVADDELVERFAALCDRAAGFGAQVQYEFMPISAMADLASVWRVVEHAGRPNGGIVFDTWHFFRSTPDYDALARVPGDRIFAVQVSDAAAEVAGSLRHDTLHRLLPGDGALDLVGVVTALDRMGALTWVGPEVLSPELAAMEPADAAVLAVERVRAVVATARAAG